jgi:hypothetical protein
MSQENVEIVRGVYEILADGFDEETVRAAIASGLVNPDAELDLRTAYSDGPVVRLATLSEFLDTQPWGRSTRFEPESFRAVWHRPSAGVPAASRDRHGKRGRG